MNLSWWINIVLLAGILLWGGVHIFFSADSYITERYAPPLVALFISVINSLLVAGLRNATFKIIGMIWVIWPVVGTYFSLAHFYERKLWASLDLNHPALVFTGATMAMLIGLHFFCAVFREPSEQFRRVKWRPLDVLPLLLFPVVYALSLLSSGGTLLSGGSVLDSMYSIERGPIYGMRIALVPLFGFLALYAQGESGSKRFAIWMLIIMTLFISVLDGKRDIALLGILVMLFIALSVRAALERSGRIMAALLLTTILYGVLSNLRADRDIELDTWISFATIAGIEYRDFAHSLNYWSPEYIETIGYNFLNASLGSLLNGNMLEAFGLNKADLIQQDSARAWQRLSLADFGIRTGVVSELYFAFPSFWPALICIFGFFIGVLHRWTVIARSDLSRMIAMTALSASTLSVFSQTSATLGYVMSLIYLMLLLVFWRFFLSLTPFKGKRVFLGSKLIDRQSQKMTVAARATAERKVFAHQS